MLPSDRLLSAQLFQGFQELGKQLLLYAGFLLLIIGFLLVFAGEVGVVRVDGYYNSWWGIWAS